MIKLHITHWILLRICKYKSYFCTFFDIIFLQCCQDQGGIKPTPHSLLKVSGWNLKPRISRSAKSLLPWTHLNPLLLFLEIQELEKLVSLNALLEISLTHQPMYLLLIQPTVGIDFLSRNITLNQRTFRLQLWDTAGQEKYKSLVPAYLRDANAAILVYEPSRP